MEPLGKPPVKRRLSAILAADAVGFSRMMAENEEGTAKLLAAHRAVIDGIIEFHEGRIVNTAGDSVIAEFASAVQAVRCAVEIQDALRTRNDSRPEAERLEFRIGVNLGDVMVKGNDLLGDGVNVAARIESITEPGGISVSSSVYDQISGKLDLGFVDAGNQSLKNIDRPVRVYRVERSGGERPARKSSRSPSVRWIVGGALVVAAAAGLWQLAWLPMQEANRKVAEREQAQREEQVAKARAEAEAEKVRAQAEAARRSTETDSVRRVAEAEVAKQRAAAEAARKQAEARAAELDETKRALEVQRAADVRSRAEAEASRLRAEAEEAKRKAAAELAAAEAIRRKAQEAVPAAPAPVASVKAGKWSAAVSCPPVKSFPERIVSIPLVRDGEKLLAEYGTRGEPGWVQLEGTVNNDGSVSFQGSGISFRAGGERSYPASFLARPVGAGYVGSGRLGDRDCNLTLKRDG